MRRSFMLIAVIVALLMLAGPIGAQDNGVIPPTPPAGEVEQGIGLLEYLVGVALIVSVLVEQLKPVLFTPIRERWSDREYMIALYATRTSLGIVAVVVYGGAAVMVGYLPLLAGVPELIVLLTGALLVAAGTEIIHPLLDMLYVLRNRIDPPVESAEQEVDLPETDSQIIAEG
jgi:hypothetical protein